MPPSVVVAAVLLLIAAGFWRLVAGGMSGAKFRVEVTGSGIEGVRVAGAVPGYGVGEVSDFIAGLELPRGAKIWGMPDRERITLRFSNTVPEALHQRLRNFFYAPLN